MPRVLLPVPTHDFDPTEAAVPWKILTERGVDVVVATLGGAPAQADPIVLDGKKLGLFRSVLRTSNHARTIYEQFAQSACQSPATIENISHNDFDALLLPGGHAKGMIPYLESKALQALTSHFFRTGRPVGAICHGVLVAARSKAEDGKSVLYGRKTTALTEAMELFAWKRTRSRLGDYYRTYPDTTVQQEVTAALQHAADFLEGPKPFLRDSLTKPSRGFLVEDGNYLSARYPGDVHRFSLAFCAKLTFE